jgi:hypothetical protein
MSGTTCASAMFIQFRWCALAPDLTFFIMLIFFSERVLMSITEELVIAGFKKEPAIAVITVTVSITLFCYG